MVTVRLLDIGPLKRFVTKEDMQAVADFVLALQKKRIAAGIGSRGTNMKRYSKAYAAERSAAGLPSDKRTLRRSGAMLDSRKVLSVSDTRARIGFDSAQKHAYVNQARTPFVKATKDERKLAGRFLARLIRERLRKTKAQALARMGARR